MASNFKQKASRGRVLAEGDVDPAAGSRDEPFKAVGRNPSTKLVSHVQHALLPLDEVRRIYVAFGEHPAAGAFFFEF